VGWFETLNVDRDDWLSGLSLPPSKLPAPDVVLLVTLYLQHFIEVHMEFDLCAPAVQKVYESPVSDLESSGVVVKDLTSRLAEGGVGW